MTKITEVIATLTEFKDKHGPDVECVVLDNNNEADTWVTCEYDEETNEVVIS